MGMFDFMDTIVDIGSSIFGHDQQRKSDTKQREQDQRQFEENLRRQDDANRINLEMANKNIEMQKEFARHGIRWRVEDAAAAGLHPLVATGGNPVGFSPVTAYQESTPSYSPGIRTDKYGFYRNLGQDISRAIRSTQTKEERVRDALVTENMQLQNDLLRSQILNNTKSHVGPSFPSAGNFEDIPGQGDLPVLNVPVKRTMSPKGNPQQEAGDRPDVSFSRTRTGRAPVIPAGLAESLEDDLVGQLLWRVRNQVMPNFGIDSSMPARSELPRGAHGWKYNIPNQEWQPDYGDFDPFSITPWSEIKRQRRRQQ